MAPKSPVVRCLDCDGDLLVEPDRLEAREIVICPECGAELQVGRLGPLELTRLEDEDDDYNGGGSATGEDPGGP